MRRCASSCGACVEGCKQLRSFAAPPPRLQTQQPHPHPTLTHNCTHCHRLRCPINAQSVTGRMSLEQPCARAAAAVAAACPSLHTSGAASGAAAACPSLHASGAASGAAASAAAASSPPRRQACPSACARSFT